MSQQKLKPRYNEGIVPEAGLRLFRDAKQFVVVEAKMFSNLSAGTKNAPSYDQAARNVACMAEAMYLSDRPIQTFERLGFFVIGPATDKLSSRRSNLTTLLDPFSVRQKLANRIAGYESAGRDEARSLRNWENEWFLPLVAHLVDTEGLRLLTWEECIGAIGKVDRSIENELEAFYNACLSYDPLRQSDEPSEEGFPFIQTQ